MEQNEKLEHYYREWSAMNDYANKIDLNYGNILTVFSVSITVVASILNAFYDTKDGDNWGLYYAFYMIPIAIISAYSFLGYQFRIVAILHGHLARIEDEINKILNERVYMWHSSLTEVYMAHNNLANNFMMAPILLFTIAVLSICVYQTFSGAPNIVIPIVYWIIIAVVGTIVLIPFFCNEKIRHATYNTEDVFKKLEDIQDGSIANKKISQISGLEFKVIAILEFSARKMSTLPENMSRIVSKCTSALKSNRDKIE